MLNKLTILLFSFLAILISLTPINAASTKNIWKTYTDPSHIQQIAIDTKGNAWLATSGGAVYVTGDGKWKTYTTSDGLANNHVIDVAIDSLGNVWLATDEGLSVLDTNGKWQTYTDKNGLLSNHIWQVETGNDGKVYILTDKGINVFSNDAWQAYTSKKDYLLNGPVHGEKY